MTSLIVSGLVPFTTVDMPGRNAAVVFCQGCCWRCRYCHNSHLQGAYSDSPIEWKKILNWLELRRGFLEAVVFSGGEPIIQQGLRKSINDVKTMGFEIGLHTGGSLPKALGDIIPLLDWIGLDIKTHQSAYDRITGINNSGKAVWESLKLTLLSGIPYEIRTTYHPDLLTESDIETLAIELAHTGVKNWVLQLFRPKGCMDITLTSNKNTKPSETFLKYIETIFQYEEELKSTNAHPKFHSHQVKIKNKTDSRTFLVR